MTQRSSNVFYEVVLPIDSNIALSLRMVAHAAVVSIFPVMVAEAPDWKANSPSLVRRARPAVTMEKR